MSEDKIISIAGTGHYLPERVVSNFDLARMMNTSDEFITARAGIRERRFADPSQTLSEMIVPAATRAVQDARLSMSDIDMLIVNTLSPDHHDPSEACLVHPLLGLRPIPAFDIRAQCSGMLYGLDIASQFIMTGKHNNVLIVCAEMLSKRLDTSDAGRNLSVLLGDGAGAVVVSRAAKGGRDHGLVDLITRADGQYFKLIYTEAPGTSRGAFLTEDDVRAGRHQFRLVGKPQAAHAVASMCAIATEILHKHGLTIMDIDLIVPHQPNVRMLEEVQRRLEVPRGRMMITADRLGNMASASMAVTLSMAREEGRLAKGALALLLGYGGGATWGAALYRV